MSRPVAATLLAAAGVRLHVSPPRARVQFDAVATPDDSGFVAALTEVGRQLTGDVRVVVLSGRTWAPASEPLDPAGVTPVAAIPTGPGHEARTDDCRDASRRPNSCWLSAQADLLTVAVLHGVVAGIGLDVALACDFRVAADDTCLTWTGAGDTARCDGDVDDRPSGDGLPRRRGSSGPDPAAMVSGVGFARALEWSLLGTTLSVDRAADLGLLNRVAHPSAVDGETEALVETLLAVPRDRAVATKSRLLRVR